METYLTGNAQPTPADITPETRAHNLVIHLSKKNIHGGSGDMGRDMGSVPTVFEG
jgi:hypothetical protein